MTDIPAGAAQAPAGPAGPSRTGDEIMLAFGGPGPQPRLTVLVRVFMAIPHLIVLYALNLAAEVVAIVGWFAALFTGRLPAGLADFLTGWLRWVARVYAYLGLLTDRYPPFELGDSDYQVRVSTAPGELNRLAVFFRFILVIPAGLLLMLAGYGLVLAAFIIWLIVLIAGTMPASLHQAVAAVLRYYVRFYGYFYLVTGTYPGGLFGDQPAGPGAPQAQAGYGVSPSYGTVPVSGQEPSAPAAEPAGTTEATETPETTEASAGTAETAGTAEPRAETAEPAGTAEPSDETAEPAGTTGTAGAAAAPAGPPAWRLVLSAPARRLVWLFIGLGVVALAGGITGGVVAGTATNPAAQRAAARSQLRTAHDKLGTALGTYQQKVAACQQDVSCVVKQDKAAAAAFGAFGQSVNDADVPAGTATTARTQLVKDTSQIVADLGQLAKAQSAGDYQRILGSTGLQQTVARFAADYQRLGTALAPVS